MIKLRASPELMRKIQFAAIGIFVMLMGYGMLFFCIEILEIDARIAYVIQAFVSVEANFFLNYYVTWRDRRENSMWNALVRFHISRVATVVGNQFLFMGLLVVMPYMAANTVCIFATTVFSYLAGEKFTFRKKKLQPNLSSS